ncbi:TetR/AcrR family transcriptional regulator [Solicola gregarius]|uniref:TetR family transcriptional regulator n=1 Tax=Solicola gregarius TaxID=2908642 RepID=A0AA46YLZ7_9ACTN|nr:TetR family transcriptional regulator [Solicola gregarius]UYM07197.1 TetR family transcriptional regulator [Solicola gregarius]
MTVARPRAAPQTHRGRIIAAAARITTESGWSDVTMARLASEVGVSRQTVYNEIGAKDALAEAMVLTELQRFLGVVEEAFEVSPHDLVDAIRAAAYGVLDLALDNRLLQAIVSATHGASTELLPLLTTHSGSLLATAKEVVARRMRTYEIPLDADRLDALVDLVVRTVLSQVMQPNKSPARSADDLAWLADRVLRSH